MAPALKGDVFFEGGNIDGCASFWLQMSVLSFRELPPLLPPEYLQLRASTTAVGSSSPFAAAQDFFQVLRPGLQLLRPPKKDARDGAGIIAGFVGYNYDAFKQEFGVEPWQVGHASDVERSL